MISFDRLSRSRYSQYRFPESVATVENVLDRHVSAGRRRGHSVPLAVHGSVEAGHTSFPAGKPAERRRRRENPTRTRALQERES